VDVSWPREPADSVGCEDGIFFPPDYDYGWRAAELRLKKLYRCGISKPRRCKMTIGRERTYVFDQTDRGTRYQSALHVTWSLTFAATGRG